jgi:hypothetical protein
MAVCGTVMSWSRHKRGQHVGRWQVSRSGNKLQHEMLDNPQFVVNMAKFRLIVRSSSVGIGALRCRSHSNQQRQERMCKHYKTHRHTSFIPPVNCTINLELRGHGILTAHILLLHSQQLADLVPSIRSLICSLLIYQGIAHQIVLGLQSPYPILQCVGIRRIF